MKKGADLFFSFSKANNLILAEIIITESDANQYKKGVSPSKLTP
jgi:hypothetical protein